MGLWVCDVACADCLLDFSQDKSIQNLAGREGDVQDVMVMILR